MLVAMKNQLHLLEPPDQRWRLDTTTREIGRKGLADARRALAQARPKRAA